MPVLNVAIKLASVTFHHPKINEITGQSLKKKTMAGPVIFSFFNG